MTTTLFNTQQNTITLFAKDPVAQWIYKERVHANTIIEKAETDYWTCKVSWQDAVCSITIPAGKGWNLFLSTLKLQKRADWDYIVDYSNNDPAIRPTPSIFNSNNLWKVITPSATITKVKSKNIVTKKTWLNLTLLLMLLLLVAAAAYKVANIRES